MLAHTVSATKQQAPAKIEAVVLDFGGVMARVYQPERFQGLEERLGLEPGSLSEILWRSPEWRQTESGKISDEEYWRRIAPRLGLQGSQAVRDFRHELYGGVTADARMVGLVRELRTRYRTGLLSNASTREPARLIERYALEGLFDVVVLSAAVGLAKPDPVIYRLALERLGTVAEATVFVDDYEPNVAAAAALGIWGIHFTGYQALLAALREWGFMVDRSQPARPVI
jgi:putative hydrolase of the HAD superfamily